LDNELDVNKSFASFVALVSASARKGKPQGGSGNKT
jgi:hypothetical protein